MSAVVTNFPPNNYPVRCMACNHTWTGTLNDKCPECSDVKKAPDRCYGNNSLGQRCCLDEGHDGDHVSWEENRVNHKCIMCAGQWQGPFGSSCPHCEKTTAAKPLESESLMYHCTTCKKSWIGALHCPKCGPPPHSSILTEAAAIISGPRRESYGPVEESFERAARVWTELLFKKLKEPLVGTDVGMAMAGLKLCREANKHDRENLVDTAGYAALLDQLHAANPSPSKEPNS